MIALKILLGFLLFIFLLLSLKLTIRIGYNGEVTVSAGTLGILIPILPKKMKAPKLKNYSYKRHQKRIEKERRESERKAQSDLKKLNRKKKNKEAKELEKQKKLPPEEMKDAPSAIRVLIRISGEIIERFFGILHVKIVRMHLVVGGPDAAATALTYAAVSQGVAYLLELLSCKTRFRRIGKTIITVEPDFLLNTVRADVCIILQIRTIELIGVGFYALWRYFREKSILTPKKPKSSEKHTKREVTANE